MARGRRSARSMVGLVALLLATGLVAVAVLIATSPDSAGMPRSQVPASARSTATPVHATAAPARLPQTPARLTWDEAIARGRNDAARDAGGIKMLDARVDEVTAEQMPPQEAFERIGQYWYPDTSGKAPPADLAWLVRASGRFHYVGTKLSVEENLATYEVSERYLVYDARDGTLLAQWMPGDDDSQMPLAKREAVATMVAHDQAVAKGLVPPDTPTPEPTSCPEKPWKGSSEIRLFSQWKMPPPGLRPTNYALVQSDSGKRYTVYGGSKTDDPQQGLVLVSEQIPDPCAEAKGLAPRFQATYLPTPFRSGPVRVYRIEAGSQVLLETPERLRVRLDFVTQRFGTVEQAAIPTPYPNPVTSGGYGTIKEEPRSSRATVGVPYPFTLQTHCGVDWMVDFGGSFWDLDDPAWVVTEETGPFYAISPNGNSQEGTMTLVDADHAVFTYDRAEIHFKRHAGPKEIPLCM